MNREYTAHHVDNDSVYRTILCLFIFFPIVISRLTNRQHFYLAGWSHEKKMLNFLEKKL